MRPLTIHEQHTVESAKTETNRIMYSISRIIMTTTTTDITGSGAG